MNITGFVTKHVTLRRGLMLANVAQRSCVLREACVGDLLEATRAAQTDTEVGLRMTLRRVVSLGEIKGPLDLELANNLTMHDLNLMRDTCNAIDKEVNGGSEQGDSKSA